jgi:hypothetical protein
MSATTIAHTFCRSLPRAPSRTLVATDPLRPTTLRNSVAAHHPDCELGDRGSGVQAILQGLRARRIMPWLAKRNTERASGLG